MMQWHTINYLNHILNISTKYLQHIQFLSKTYLKHIQQKFKIHKMLKDNYFPTIYTTYTHH